MPIHFEWTHSIFKQTYSKSSKFISQAKVHLQVCRHGSTFLPVCRPINRKNGNARQDLCACAAVAPPNKILDPPLRVATVYISSLVSPNDEWDCGQVFSSALTVESNMERRAHTPGAKPRVDYCLVRHVWRKIYTSKQCRSLKM